MVAKLHFYYSAMNAGKSTTLLQSSHNYNERGMDTLIYVPVVDNRHGVGRVSTRIGINKEAIVMGVDFDIYAHAKQCLVNNPNIKCVLIDEAQFLTKKQINQLGDICDELNIPVLAYGIRTDFRGEPFPGSLYLLAWADILIEIKTICHCGSKAIMNMRIDAEGRAVTEGEQVEIGGNDRYLSTCRHHFKRGEGMRQGHRLGKQVLVEENEHATV